VWQCKRVHKKAKLKLALRFFFPLHPWVELAERYAPALDLTPFNAV
jgi:hypothetical protein